MLHFAQWDKSVSGCCLFAVEFLLSFLPVTNVSRNSSNVGSDTQVHIVGAKSKEKPKKQQTNSAVTRLFKCERRTFRPIGKGNFQSEYLQKKKKNQTNKQNKTTKKRAIGVTERQLNVFYWKGNCFHEKMQQTEMFVFSLL